MKYELIDDNIEYNIILFTMSQQDQDKKVETLLRKYVDADNKCTGWLSWMPSHRKACNEATVDALMETYKYAQDVFKDVQVQTQVNNATSKK